MPTLNPATNLQTHSALRPQTAASSNSARGPVKQDQVEELLENLEINSKNPPAMYTDIYPDQAYRALLDDVKEVIRAIKTATDGANMVSTGTPGVDQSQKSANFSRLKAIVEAADEQFKGRLKIYLSGVETDFCEGNSAPSSATSPTNSSSQTSAATGNTAAPTNTLVVAGQTFAIESTATNPSDANGSDDRLTYALQSTNGNYASNSRRKVFTAEKILVRLGQMDLQNRLDGHTDEESLVKLKQEILASYNINLRYARDYRDLSIELANYIQTSGCALDVDIAGGVLAARRWRERPTIFVSIDAAGAQRFVVFNEIGEMVGKNLDKLPDNGLIDFTKAQFVLDRGNGQFERLKPARHPVGTGSAGGAATPATPSVPATTTTSAGTSSS
jgi:hypothetical protein